MAFRLAGSRLIQSAAPRVSTARTAMLSTSAVAPAAGSDIPMPSAKDVIISLNFVDHKGARRKVPGIIGT